MLRLNLSWKDSLEDREAIELKYFQDFNFYTLTHSFPLILILTSLSLFLD